MIRTESALLKRMLELVLHTAGAVGVGDISAADRRARQARLYIRLTAGDRQLLQERSAARCLAPATSMPPSCFGPTCAP